MVARPACDRIDYISKHEKKDNEDERAQKTVFLTEYGKSKVRVGFRKIKIFSQPLARPKTAKSTTANGHLGLDHLVAETLGISEGVKPYINAIQPVGSNDNTDYGPHRTDKDCPDDHEGRQSGKNIEKKGNGNQNSTGSHIRLLENKEADDHHSKGKMIHKRGFLPLFHDLPEVSGT